MYDFFLLYDLYKYLFHVILSTIQISTETLIQIDFYCKMNRSWFQPTKTILFIVILLKSVYDIHLIFDPRLNPLSLLHDLNPFFVNLFLSYLSLVRVLHEIFLRLHKSFSVSIQLYRLQLSPAHFCVTLALIFVVFSILNI